MDLPRQTIESEYKYLNDLTLARIRDANSFWITSMILLSGVCVLADKMQNWLIIIPGLLSMIPICHAISWNLEGIMRARTYIAIVIEPTLGGFWEKAWSNHPVMKKNFFPPEIVPIIFISMYVTMTIYMNIIAMHLCNNIMGIILIIIVDTFILFGFAKIFNSFSRSKWKEYTDGWKLVLDKNISYTVSSLIFLIISSTAGPQHAFGYNRHHNVVIDKTQVSISGVSAGGYMASQVNVSYSSIFSGVGIISGGFYGCAEGGLSDARNFCMPGIELEELYKRSLALAVNLDEKGDIDKTSHLTKTKVAILAGGEDKSVNPASSLYTEKFYKNFCTDTNISRKNIPSMPHGISSPEAQIACNKMTPPYIYNCDFDTARFILETIYGNIQNGQFDINNLHKFNQQKITKNETIDDYGFSYTPKQCYTSKCKLHIVLHGCNQGKEFVGNKFVIQSGYLNYAELNNIILIFPQNKATKENPYGCWDWWGYTGKRYYTKNSIQIKFLKKLVDKVSYIANTDEAH